MATAPEVQPVGVVALGEQDDVASIAAISAARREKLVDGLCFIHAKYGHKAYNCAAASCKMKKILKKKPKSVFSGNGNAGGQ